MWPGGEQPRTAPPVFVPITSDTPGTDASPDGGRFTSPLLLQLYCGTHGASIAYTTEAGDDPHWLLYSEPIRLPEGETVVRARAIRIGYRESEERVAALTVD